MSIIADFVSKVKDAYKTGIAREHACRPALHDLLKALGDDLTPVNDAAKSEVGAPDFIVLKGEIPIGHLEAKDINLDIRKLKDANAPDVSWTFYIGGYQPAQKWLKDRKGRALSFDDVKHYQRILKILAETDRIMQTITMTLEAA